MRVLARWFRREPWMALNASIASLCALTVVAIRWLAVLGIIRAYATTHTWGADLGSPVTYHRQLGLLSGPSAALTRVDVWSWRVGFIAGLFWVLRLGLRSANRRIGGLRTLGVVVGLGVFVVTGVGHVIADVVVPAGRARARTQRLITVWCGAAVLTAIFVGVTSNRFWAETDAPGTHAVLVPVGWSIATNAMQLLVAVGGWSIAAFLTHRWVARPEHDAARGALLTV